MKKLIFILGPIAVGKRTVGQSLKNLTGFPLMHNHHSIEVALDFFNFDDPGFAKINMGIRDVVFNTFATRKEVEGFIFTYVVDFNDPSEWEYLQSIEKIFDKDEWETYYVELVAPIEIRLQRNKTENRLINKASKRKLETSEANLKYSRQEEMREKNYLIIDNSHLSPDEVAEKVVNYFGLV